MVLFEGQKDWGRPEKRAVRESAIVGMYSRAFGVDSIPRGRQYWTMCGQCVDKAGKLIFGCEYDHLRRLRFFRPSQFFGVEGNRRIARLNEKADKRANWVRGEFVDVMQKHASNAVYKPAVVNYDSLHFADTNAREGLPRVLELIQVMGIKDVMVIHCGVLDYAHARVEPPERLVDAITENPIGMNAWLDGNWRATGTAYTYKGTGTKGSGIVMGVVAFFR